MDLQPEATGHFWYPTRLGLGKNRTSGVDERANMFAVGTHSCSSCRCLGPSSTLSAVTPVTLPPGRFRLATSPALTGSAAVRKTIGIEVVAALAATTAGVTAGAAITVT